MIKVLVIDDSAVVRRVLSAELSKSSDIEVVATAIDPYVAREKIIALRPDVITLDLEMPRMDGLTFLAKLMKHYPLPVIVVSSLTREGSDAAMKALELGAVDVIAKPGSSYSIGEISQMLVDRVRAAAATRHSAPSKAQPPSPCPPQASKSLNGSGRILAIGASTGGTGAIKNILMGLPENTPPTVVVQHMPAGFTKTFAERLNQQCPMEVREAQNNDRLTAGTVLVAPGNRHMVIRRDAAGYKVKIKDGPMVHHQRPSVDVLFHSVAEQAGADAVGVILTGMGSDGARGLLAMRRAGAATLTQDEQSCIIFGMPQKAIELDAVDKVASLCRMPEEILKTLTRTMSAKLCASGSTGTNE